jgi:hypothetical protein
MDEKRKQLTTMMKPSLLKKLKILAAEREVRVTDLIEEAIVQYLEKPIRKQKKKE